MFLNKNSAIESSMTLRQQDKDTGEESGTKIGISGDEYKDNDTMLWGLVGLGAEYMITKELSIRASINGVFLAYHHHVTILVKMIGMERHRSSG